MFNHRLTNIGIGTENISLGRALRDFELAAAKFKAENNRPAVLMYDNINIVAEKDPDLLSVLQARAKDVIDKDLYKVVFVCSDRVAPAQMRGEFRLISQLGMQVLILLQRTQLGHVVRLAVTYAASETSR